MKKISLYVKGGEHDAGYYYRFHQYLREMKVEVWLHKMYSDGVYQRYLPVGNKPIFVKIALWIYSAMRVTWQLFKDCFRRPDVLIISRRLVSRWSPQIINIMVAHIKRRGAKVIWDFDDNIRASRECDKRAFKVFCEKSDHIILASKHLEELVPDKYQFKIINLPSTDGELVKNMTEETQLIREDLYKHEVRTIWVGTQVSLHFVEEIFPYLERAGEQLGKNKKKLVLTVVCDKAIEYNPLNFSLRSIKWTREVATKELIKSHIGLMPLDVNEFTSGKGGFKLIQYLSIGLPVIATAVGINDEIVREGVGFKTAGINDDEWTNGILNLSYDIDKWRRYSINAITEYKNFYSADDVMNTWERLINS